MESHISEGSRRVTFSAQEDKIVSFRVIGPCEADSENYVEIEWKYASGRIANTCFAKINLPSLKRQLRQHS